MCGCASMRVTIVVCTIVVKSPPMSKLGVLIEFLLETVANSLANTSAGQQMSNKNCSHLHASLFRKVLIHQTLNFEQDMFFEGPAEVRKRGRVMGCT